MRKVVGQIDWHITQLTGDISPQVGGIPIGNTVTISASVLNISPVTYTCYLIVQDSKGNRVIDWNGELASFTAHDASPVTVNLIGNETYWFVSGYLAGVNWVSEHSFDIPVRYGFNISLISWTYPEQNRLDSVDVKFTDIATNWSQTKKTDASGNVVMNIYTGNWKVEATKSNYICEPLANTSCGTWYFDRDMSWDVFLKPAGATGGGPADIWVYDRCKNMTAQKGYNVIVEGAIKNTDWNPLNFGRYKVVAVSSIETKELDQWDIGGLNSIGWSYNFLMPSNDVTIKFDGYHWNATTSRWDLDKSDYAIVKYEPTVIPWIGVQIVDVDGNPLNGCTVKLYRCDLPACGNFPAWILTWAYIKEQILTTTNSWKEEGIDTTKSYGIDIWYGGKSRATLEIPRQAPYKQFNTVKIDVSAAPDGAVGNWIGVKIFDRYNKPLSATCKLYRCDHPLGLGCGGFIDIFGNIEYGWTLLNTKSGSELWFDNLDVTKDYAIEVLKGASRIGTVETVKETGLNTWHIVTEKPPWWEQYWWLIAIGAGVLILGGYLVTRKPSVEVKLGELRGKVGV